MHHAPSAPTLDLAGSWRFRLDPDDRGLVEGWAAATLDGTIVLPGTLAGAGIGFPVTRDTAWNGLLSDEKTFLDPKYDRLGGGTYKPPFWLATDRYYNGAAWYQRDVIVPDDWAGRDVLLELERPHWETGAWLDGVPLGTSRALSTPHRYELGGLRPGPHALTLRIDNRYLVGVGLNAHSVTDNTTGNWNGVAGYLRLVARDPVRVEHLAVGPATAGGKVPVAATCANTTGRNWRGTLELRARLRGREGDDAVVLAREDVVLGPGTTRLELSGSLGPGHRRWSEWEPAVYELEAWLHGAGAGTAPRRTDFGLRTLSTSGTTFRIDGRPLHLRGTLECNVFPAEGHTATDEATWERMYRTAIAWGFNHFRFHSWCPPEAAFAAADRLGVYLQVECCCWVAHEVKLGEGMPVDRYVHEETGRILREYGNHPSFCFMTYGNEADGKNNVAFLADYVSRWKREDPRRLYSSSSGWPTTPANDYCSALRGRAQRYVEGGRSTYYLQDHAPTTDFDFSADVAEFAVPLVSHEPGMWCVSPDFDELPRYRGPFKPRNLELFRDELAEHHLADQARDFLRASGRLQVLCYKAEIEAMLRTPGLGGFQLLSLTDFPGQGTALVGPLNVFWDPKGYVEAREWRTFCAPTVLLAAIPSLVLSPDDTLEARVLTTHHGRAPLPGARIAWRLEGEGKNVVASGTLGPRDVPLGSGTSFGEVRVPLAGCAAPATFRFVLELQGTDIANAWDIHLFPPCDPRPATVSVHRCRRLDAAARSVLASGGTVLLEVHDSVPEHRRARTGFTPVYWNVMCFFAQPIHTMGILCDPRHPAFGAFPTREHTDYRWWDILTRSHALVLDAAPPAFRPFLQVIDSYHGNRKLGLLAEARVGKGRLVLSGIDLRSDMDRRPAARQLEASLLAYLRSDAFRPVHELDEDFFRDLGVVDAGFGAAP